MAAFLALGPPLPAALPPALLSSPPASLSHPEPPVPLLARSPGSQAASPPAADPLKQAGQTETREALQGQLHRDSRVPIESFLLTRHSPRAPQQDPGGCGAALTPSPAPLGLPWAFPFSRSLLSTRIPSCRTARTHSVVSPRCQPSGPHCPLLRSPCRRAGTAPERAVPPDHGSFPPHCSAPRPDQGTSRSPSPWPAGHSVTSPGRCHPALPLAGRGRWELRAASPCGTRRGARGPWRAEARSCRPSLGVQSISRRCEAGSRGPARGTAEFLLAPSTFRGCSTHRAPAAGTPSSVPSRGG